MSDWAGASSIIEHWEAAEFRIRVLEERLDIVWDALTAIQARIRDIEATTKDDGK